MLSLPFLITLNCGTLDCIRSHQIVCVPRSLKVYWLFLVCFCFATRLYCFVLVCSPTFPHCTFFAYLYHVGGFSFNCFDSTHCLYIVSLFFLPAFFSRLSCCLLVCFKFVIVCLCCLGIIKQKGEEKG